MFIDVLFRKGYSLDFFSFCFSFFAFLLLSFLSFLSFAFFLLLSFLFFLSFLLFLPSLSNSTTGSLKHKRMGRGKRHLPPSKQKKKGAPSTSKTIAKIEEEKEKEEREEREEKEEKEKEKSLFDLLSPSLQMNIFKRLKPRELCVCVCVCKSWQKVMCSNELWWPHAMKVFFFFCCCCCCCCCFVVCVGVGFVTRKNKVQI